MGEMPKTIDQLNAENAELRSRLEGTEDALEAIRSGSVDALVVETDQGEQIFPLQGAERPYRVMVETMNEGAATLMSDGYILYANPRLAAFLEEPVESLIGSSIYDFIAPADTRPFRAALEAGLRQPGKMEIRLYRRNRTPIPFLISFSPIDVEGNPALCLVLTDLSEHFYADQLMRSNKELQDFAFVASHDLQEPLRKIIGFSDMLGARPGLDETEKDYIRRMQDAARRMKRMIDDLLELSRLNTRSRSFMQVDLNEALKSVVEDLEAPLRLTQGSVVLNPLPVIEADPGQIQRLFQNLLSNAIKFHRPAVPPQIQVGYREGSLIHVEIYVKDNGIGFEMSQLDQIFLPFRRLHSRAEYEGTGIGLAICQRITERHGGWITARSVPDEGSTFLVMLPVKQSEGK
jgi:PAS domain S-box-containing protein